MNKFKIPALAALAAATVVVGALAAAPSASALHTRPRKMGCNKRWAIYRKDSNVLRLLIAAGYGDTQTARDYRDRVRFDMGHLFDEGCI
jgi:hypothetical protein